MKVRTVRCTPYHGRCIISFLFSVYARKCQMICQTYWHNNYAAKEKTPSITLNMLFISVALRSLPVWRSAFLSQPAVSHQSVSWELMSKALFCFFTCCAFDAGVHKLLGAAEHEDRQRRFISVSSGLPLFSLFLWIFPFFLSPSLSNVICSVSSSDISVDLSSPDRFPGFQEGFSPTPVRIIPFLKIIVPF